MGRRAGSASTSAATSPWPTRSAREIIAAGPREPRVHRPRDDRTSRPTRRRSSRTRSSTPSARPASRPRRSASWPTPSPRRRPGDDLLDARHHRAPQRGRQRPGADLRSSLLTGHVGRYGSGVNPLRGQNNVQGGGDMGALPDRLPGFQHVENDALRAKFDAEWGVAGPAEARLAPVGDVRRDGARRPDRASTASARTRSSPRPTRSARSHLLDGPRLPRRPGHLPDQDRRARRRRPAGHRGLGREPRAPSPTPSGASSACARRSSRRARRATTCAIIFELAQPDGRATGARPTPRPSGTRSGALSPVHAGMSYARLEELGGLQWPCYDETHPGELFLHSRLWEDPVPGQPRAVRAGRPRPAGRQARRRLPDPPDDRPPARLVQHRRPDRPATRRRCAAARSLDIVARGRRDATAWPRASVVRVVSRRGQVEVAGPDRRVAAARA